MNSGARPALTPQLVVGFLIALLGVVLTLERFGVNSWLLRLFWPSVLIAIGGTMILRRADSRGRFWGIFWASLGAWLLFDRLGWIAVSPGEMIVPLALILLGALIVSRTLEAQGSGFCRPARPRRPHRGPTGPVMPPPIPDTPSSAGIPQSDVTGRVSLFAIMGEAKRASNDNPFRGGEMTAIMGGCVLDLRQATIPRGGRAVITIVAVMAGHDIWVPRDWVVVSEVVPMLGGADDKRLAPLEPLPADAPRLVLKGFVLMGGVVIKS